MEAKQGFIRRGWIGVIIGVAAAGAILSVVYSDLNGKKGSRLGPEFQYNLDRLLTTDPALIMYEEIEPRIDTGFTWPQAIAIGPEGRIYVTGEQAVHTFDAGGQRLPLAIELEREATAIAAAEDGSIYLAAGDHIEIYSASGSLQNRWESAGPRAVLTSIGVGKEDVFVADFGSRSVHHYDTTGQLKNTFGDFVLPSSYFDLAISPDGYVQVANTGKHRVEEYAFNGNLMTWWGEFSNQDIKGFCGCCNPVNFALLPNREGFVTCEKGLTRVKIYKPDGAFVGFVAGPEQFTQHESLTAAPDYCFSRMGLDVAIDAQGRVLVLDPAMGKVRIFKRKQVG